MKVAVEDLNRFLVCPICNGYYRDCHTIPECMHSFCKVCLIDQIYPENAKPTTNCPTCNISLGLKPFTKIVYDRNIQAIVDKIFPQYSIIDLALASNDTDAVTSSDNKIIDVLEEPPTIQIQPALSGQKHDLPTVESVSPRVMDDEVNRNLKRRRLQESMDSQDREGGDIDLQWVTLTILPATNVSVEKRLPRLVRESFRIRKKVLMSRLKKEVLSRLNSLPDIGPPLDDLILLVNDSAVDMKDSFATVMTKFVSSPIKDTPGLLQITFHRI